MMSQKHLAGPFSKLTLQTTFAFANGNLVHNRATLGILRAEPQKEIDFTPY